MPYCSNRNALFTIEKFECKECKFKGKCETENMPMLCVCNECYNKSDFVEEVFFQSMTESNISKLSDISLCKK
jgi:hypothetical protein